MTNVKFDIPEWVNWLARDKSGALYGYRLMPIRCYDIWGSGEYVNDTSNSIFITELLIKKATFTSEFFIGF